MSENTIPEHPLRRLSLYTREHRGRVALATLYSMLNKLFDLAPPVLIGMAVDVVVSAVRPARAEEGVECHLRYGEKGLDVSWVGRWTHCS